jgi:hypothetical protein
MAEVVQSTPQEFWRPPSPMVGEAVSIIPSVSTMAEVCPHCGSEFLVGSKFCHSCGGKRPHALSATTQQDAAVLAGIWEQTVGVTHRALSAWKDLEFPSWLNYLHFHEIKRQIGLSTGSLIAFVIGLGCVAGALLVGLLTAKTLIDWQAIQFYRAEWLLAATAAFVAGILLNRHRSDEHDD